jgi:chromosome segregation ATPase
MKALIPLGGMLCAALLCGCQDNAQEVSKLRADLTAEQKRFDEASNTWASERDAMRADIAALKAQLGTLDTASATPMAERIKELETRVDAGAKPDPELAAKVEALSRQIDGVRQEAVEAAKLEAAKAATGEMDEEKIAALMAKKLAEEQAANAPTKNLGQALDRLDISQAEREQIRQSIIDAKKQILEALEVPTEDGRVMAEELIDAFIKIQNGDAQMTDVHKVVGELAAKKVPGDIEGRTYLDVINGVKARNKEEIGRILSPEDQKKLSAAHEDWTDFEVGDDDPWGALYLERIQKYQKENGE